MLLTVCGGKIHLARVTQAELNYHGSVTIDQDLLDASGILPNQFVNIWNKTNGARLQTYVFPGERGSKVICINGAAARNFQLGDEVIIATEVIVTMEEYHNFKAKVCICDAKNNIISNMVYQVYPDASLGNGHGLKVITDGESKEAQIDFADFKD